MYICCLHPYIINCHLFCTPHFDCCTKSITVTLESHFEYEGTAFSDVAWFYSAEVEHIWNRRVFPLRWGLKATSFKPGISWSGPQSRDLQAGASRPGPQRRGIQVRASKPVPSRASKLKPSRWGLKEGTSKLGPTSRAASRLGLQTRPS